jgi:hypothetical protein
MAKIKDLKNAPDWLKRARVRDEDVEIVNGVVVWKAGTWEGGIWEGGTWEDGIWRGGLWLGGAWEGGIWEDGTWRDGLWLGGAWWGGIWRGGTWEDGIWRGGTWEDGTWEGGIWEDGTWRDGTWVTGYQAPVRCKWRILIQPDFSIKVGCMVKTANEWEAWLESGDEFETPRTDPAFKDIALSIKVACYAAKLRQKVAGE